MRFKPGTFQAEVKRLTTSSNLLGPVLRLVSPVLTSWKKTKFIKDREERERGGKAGGCNERQ